MSSKKETAEINKKLGFNLIGKLFIKKLNRFIEKSAANWDVPADAIVMQLKLLNEDPHVLIKETHNNQRSIIITEKLGSLEAMGKLVIKRLLISNTYMADAWKVPVEQIRMDLRMVDKKPEVRILEENGTRYLDMIL